MKRTVISSVLTGLLCLTGSTGLTRAADLPLGVPPGPAMTVPQGAVGATLTAESLGTMLSSMGYPFQKTSSGAYRVDLSRAGRNFWVDVWVSSDQRIIASAPLTAELTPDRIPASVFLKLLEQNDYLGNARFFYAPDAKRIYLVTDLDNSQVTATRLRAMLEHWVEAAVASVSAWDASQWPKTDARTADTRATPELPIKP